MMNRIQVENENVRDTDVAVIGICGRFPSATSTGAFWKNLCEGVESIRVFDDAELKRAGYPPETLDRPDLVKAASILDDIDLFDAEFFGYSPREAELMDPQQRLFLECSWEAMENAGHTSQGFPGLIGVFAGSGINTYLISLANSQPEIALNGLQLTIGNDKDYLASRVSYKLNLTGPSVCVQTACSTSLVSVHLACQSLINFECDMALAGGVSIRAPQPLAYRYIEDGIASPDGHCRTFDAKAQGTIFGNGLGVVVLRRLADALQSGDHIYAVIRGTAINNDGSQKVGYTAPSFEGQVRVIRAALAAAEVRPETISYLETHGTATALGDSIEIAALKQVFGSSRTVAVRPCALGAVKTNVGHLDTAAGITGLIKTILCLQHRRIPPTLHFASANPALELDKSPFFIPTHLTPWRQEDNAPRRAGVSSFGIGGTNAHAVLQEAPSRVPSASVRSHHLIVLSARSEDALRASRGNLAGYLRLHPELPLADVAYTTQIGRVPQRHRQALACHDLEEVIRVLEQQPSSVAEPCDDESTAPSLVFMFPGQGAQHPHMAAGLYRSEPRFRKHVDACAELFRPRLGIDIRSLLYPQPGMEESAADTLRQTAYAQPALFTIEYALTRLWMEWGIHPDALLGHSIGELSAACLAGVFSLEDSVQVVAERGRCMQSQPEGAMLAVALSEDEARSFCVDGLSLAAVNAPGLCVIAGARERIADLQTELGKQQVSTRILGTSHAYHSTFMDGAIAPLRKTLDTVRLAAPRIPMIDIRGRWMQPATAVDPAYWASQLRHTVQFSEGFQTVTKLPRPLLLEVGPMQTLCKITRQHRSGPKAPAWPSLPEAETGSNDSQLMVIALGELWRHGIPIDWQRFHQDEFRYRVPLPAYPFQRKRYWLGETKPSHFGKSIKSKPERARPEDWFYLPEWRQSPPPHLLPAKKISPQGSWLLFVDLQGLGAEVATRLREAGDAVVEVRPGASFEQLGESCFCLCPQEPAHYRQLIEALLSGNRAPHSIAHFWNVAAERTTSITGQIFAEAQHSGLESLLNLAQASRLCPPTSSIDLLIFANRIAGIFHERVQSEKATSLGICRVIQQEYPLLRCRIIDVQPASRAELAIQVADEMRRTDSSELVAYRGSQRWTQGYRPFPLAALPKETSVFRDRGAYIITGGLGGLGLGLARSLVERYKARLALISRPNPDPSVQSNREKSLRELEAMGAEILVLTSDVTRSVHISAAVDRVRERFGTIHGVFHLAGTPGGGLMDLANAQSMAKVLAPKAIGAVVLEEALRNERLDFMVLFSSITSVTGGLGQADYCAANTFLNAFPNDLTLAVRYPVIAVAWDAWQSDTWQDASFNKNLPAIGKALKEYRQKFGITFAEGFEILQRAIAAGLPNILISTRDLEESIENHKNYAHSLMGPDSRRRSEMQSPAPGQTGSAAPARNAVEQKILEVWKEVLGLANIGVHDSFIDLGGHSLLAIQLTARLRQEFPGDIGLKMIFERPTIAAQAELLGANAAQAETSEEELLRLIEEIDCLSPEEVQQKLADARD